MGKRSNFERVERDFYPTPYEAVLPLVPHLPKSCTFYEPCAGNGALIDHLENLGFTCILAADVEPQREDIECCDAFEFEDIINIGADFIITNPPWKREILHPMINYFSGLRPTWLLFDASWPFTKQAAPYMQYLQKIVAVGRIKWIPDSPHTGKDDAAWYLFDSRNSERTKFYGREWNKNIIGVMNG